MTINDQKVREKLANFKLPEDKYASAYLTLGYKWADALLQSPELRVMLVEPRFYAVLRPPHYFYSAEKNSVWAVHDRHNHDALMAKFYDCAGQAEEYADWLNSKEPKS